MKPVMAALRVSYFYKNTAKIYLDAEGIDIHLDLFCSRKALEAMGLAPGDSVFIDGFGTVNKLNKPFAEYAPYPMTAFDTKTIENEIKSLLR